MLEATSRRRKAKGGFAVGRKGPPAGRARRSAHKVMKICMTLLVRDEDDILEANLRFHLAMGVDFFIVTDNRSLDRTPEILAAYERRGIVRVIREEQDDFSQWVWVTRMARLAATEVAADWVINSDADEFWWPRSGDLKSALATLPPDCGVLSVRRFNFIPRPAGGGSLFERMVVREAASFDPKGAPLPPKVIHRADPAVVVAQGNHSLDRSDLRPCDGFDPIELLHFPVRDYQQLERKIVAGGRAVERNSVLPPTFNWTWRELYERYGRGELREHYRGLELPPAEVERGIAAGRLLIDRRLQEFFRRQADGRS
jgi:hypothetical protein